MPIQTHTLETTQQANGSTHNVLRMYDQDGKELIATFYATVDPSSLVAGHIALADAHLAEQEFNEIVSVE
jgi:hypothetical protein